MTNSSRKTVIKVLLTFLLLGRAYGQLRGSTTSNAAPGIFTVVNSDQRNNADPSAPRTINNMNDFLNICNNLIENGNAMVRV